MESKIKEKQIFRESKSKKFQKQRLFLVELSYSEKKFKLTK